MNAPLCTEEKIDAILNILTNVGTQMHCINNGNGDNDDILAIMGAVAKVRTGEKPVMTNMAGLVARFQELQTSMTAHFSTYSPDYWAAIFAAAVATLREWQPTKEAIDAYGMTVGNDCNIDDEDAVMMFRCMLDATQTLDRQRAENNG